MLPLAITGIKMKKIKVGQIGKGSFGNKILSKINLIDDFYLSWVYGTQDRWWDFSMVDWVIIASPNEFHYEQAKYFLSKGVNVFCEKPGTLSLDQLRNLIKFSDSNNLHFYIDDVLVYEKIKPTYKFIYKKQGGNLGNIINRMAYHHFYLVHQMIGNIKPTNLSINTNEPNNKIFTIEFSQFEYYFEYDFNWDKERVHSIKPQFIGDALKSMLENVLNYNVDFSLNHQRSLYSSETCNWISLQL